MKGRLMLVAVVVAAFAWYMIGTAPAPREVAEVGPAKAFTCAAPTETIGHQTTFTPPPAIARPVAGTVPEDFTPVEAVVCAEFTEGFVDADRSVKYYESHYAGDFSEAIEQLNAPSARTSLLPDDCSMYSMPMIPDMFLLDADGRAVEPMYPPSDCGVNLSGLFAAQDLPEVEKVEHTIQLTDDGIEALRGCSPEFAVPEPGPRTLEPNTLSFEGLCHFALPGSGPAFRGVTNYGYDDEVALADVMPALRPAPPCTQRATTVFTTIGHDFEAIERDRVRMLVELDGCRRVLADGLVPLGPLTDSLADQLAFSMP